MLIITICQFSPERLRLAYSSRCMVLGLLSFEAAVTMLSQGLKSRNAVAEENRQRRSFRYLLLLEPVKQRESQIVHLGPNK